MALEQEKQTFKRELPRLLQDPTNRGKYVLIQGDQVYETYPTVDEGLEAGYAKFDLQPFMVQEINDNPEPKYFSGSVKHHP